MVSFSFGQWGFGLSSKIIKCDECVNCDENNFDSLNVSAAFAILCDRMLNVIGKMQLNLKEVAAKT